VKLLVRLGNPGDKYRGTRHNIGFRFVDMLADHAGLKFAPSARFKAHTAAWEAGGDKVLLVKPQTWMNNSGEAIAPLARYYKVQVQDIIVAYDDLDLPAGKVRIRHGGGHGGHNGLKSIHSHLGSGDYIRIKFGIGRPDHGDVTAWVLGRADAGDRALEDAAMGCTLPETETILEGRLPEAANRIHLCMKRKTEPDQAKETS
jgi:PTH1 family peptidyl-tRNA hydrolase